jgi:hypothetical protein
MRKGIAMSATLLLTRPFGLADAARPFQVVLDGEPVGEIRNNSRTEIPVVAGEHTLQIRTPNIITRRPGRGSPEVFFEAGDGDTAEFTCRCPRYPRASYWYLACVLGDSDRWIELDQVQ